MRTRINRNVPRQLMASTVITDPLAEIYIPEILVYEKKNVKMKLRVNKFAKEFAEELYSKYGITQYNYSIPKLLRFVERFFPRNEQELDSTINFLRERRRSIKSRKKPLVGSEALRVA